ncbi:unnamed protein product [Pseudo-nitzschia multistriata]|uniref:Uncharacterized protein n=1 Tax=Pseudo-nitzschia multistriata TaxID=183589 RepID=A0A448ZRY2_9STRA|nr:unnamed protein product [Pseudo-nitzschia multistriata]
MISGPTATASIPKSTSPSPSLKLFNPSMVSGSGASLVSTSNDETPGSYSCCSAVSSMKEILKSVYRCDSAAVVDGDASCGSTANQALYQGVEVILRKTTCNYGNDLKTSVASRPFFEYRCFCDDDDFLPEDVYSSPQVQQEAESRANKVFGHVRSGSTGTLSSGESRNEQNPTEASSENDQGESDERNAAEETVRTEADAPSTPRPLRTHTRDFYSKIHSPTKRSITRLYDIVPASPSSFSRSPKSVPVDGVPSSIETSASEPVGVVVSAP